MSTELTGHASAPPPNDQAHEDSCLMHDLTVTNTQLGRYVLRYLEADNGHANPVPTTDERALADRLHTAAEAVFARANRRDQDEQP